MKNRYLYKTFWLAVVGVLLFACEEGPNFKDYSTYYPQHTATGMSPESGYPGTSVTIEGENFGDLAGAVKVFFGGIKATTIVSCTDNQIVVTVPDDAISGKVTLQVWTYTSDSIGSFTVIPPSVVTGVSPERGQPGEEAIIKGEKFGTDIDDVHVFIGDVEATVISVSDTEIKFTIPDAESGQLVLHIGTQELPVTFFLVGVEKLSGTVIGHASSWGDNSATYKEAALDGDLTTFVDAPTATGYVGYDVGAGKGATLSSVRFAPRASHPSRMVGGEIRGANDPTLYDFVTLYTITEQPAVGTYTEVSISSEQSFRYIYYYSASGYCNISEIEFYGNIVDNELPRGKFVYDFTNAGETDYWVGMQNSTNVIEDGKLKVTFDPALFGGTSKRRADLNFVSGGTFPATSPNGHWHYSKDYPILAIKIAFTGTGAAVPGTGNIKLDRFNGAQNNAYLTDYLTKNVIYYDCSIAFTEDQDLASFTLKIADITSTEETGYEVDWIRSFKSVEELAAFIGN